MDHFDLAQMLGMGTGFQPHGMCYLWNPRLLWLQVSSDLLIALAYFSIPAMLAFFVSKRSDVPFPWIFRMFGMFIVACGLTHLLSVVTIWNPVYWLDGWVKAGTAGISVATAAVLFPLIPRALNLRSPHELDAVNRRLEAALREQDELIVKYEREARVSSTFQRASLPAALPEIPGMTLDSFYEPGKAEALIGGDWYDAVRLSDGRIVVSIGDVTGSGLQAAVAMASIRQVIRGVAYMHPDPVMMLAAADKTLRSEDPDRIVTAFVGVIDPVTMTFTYASAGHPAPCLRRPDGTIVELDHHGLMLGLRGRGEPPAKTVALDPGSVLVLYTDGLIESTRDLVEGSRRLHAALADATVRESPHFAKALHDAVLFDGVRDDVAILTIAISEKTGVQNPKIARWTFDVADPAAARAARGELLAFLRAGGMQQEEMFAAELVFGELLGNVVRYAPGDVRVAIDWSGQAPVLHVIDGGTGFWGVPRLPADPLSEGGRGLFLVSELTDDLHIGRETGTGTHVRAILALDARQQRGKF